MLVARRSERRCNRALSEAGWPIIMALTRNFKATILARAACDPKFHKELLREGIKSLLTGDIATAKAILRDYIASAARV